MKFRAFDASVEGNPAWEAGDAVVLTDRKGNSYYSYLTNVSYNIGNYASISCGAEPAERHSADRYAEINKIVSDIKKDAQKELTKYEKFLEQLNSLATNAMGYYETQEKQDDGSTIMYMHDKPDLKDSTVVYKKTIDGFFWSKNSGKTWTSGINKDGNAVLNVIAATGLNAEWVDAGTMSANRVRGGTFEVGGTGAGKDGAIVLRNSSGVQIGKFDKNGLTATAGKFSGDITGASGAFSGAIKNDNGSFYSELSNGVLKGGQKSGAITGYISFDNYKTSSGVYGLRLAGKGCAVILTPSFGIANYVQSGSVTYSEGQSGSITVVTGISASWSRINLTGSYDVPNLCQNLSLSWNTKTVTFTKGLMTTKL